MSYLKLEKGIPNFEKAVISLWFRLPQAAIDAAAGAAPSLDPFFRTIPLLVFGQPQKQIVYTPNNVDVAVGMGILAGASIPVILQTPSYTASAGVDLAPCYIGVDCSDPGNPTLVVNIQKNDFATLASNAFYAPVVEVWSTLDPGIPPTGLEDPSSWPPGNGWSTPEGDLVYFTPEVTDVSGNTLAKELFTIRMNHVLAAEHWHHLLMAADLSTACTTHSSARPDGPFATTAEGTVSACKMWIAIDDVNYNGNELGPFNVDGTTDQNLILTRNAYNTANQGGPALPFNVAIPDTSTCNYPASNVPSSTYPFGIPAIAQWVNDIHAIEMAEFQMFTGVTLNTSITSNRRAFIDTDGKPVPPDKKASSTDPQSGSIEFMGSSPTLLLHKSGNWKSGRNTGSAGIDSDGNVIPDGQFVRVAGIISYKPDPSLHGPQGTP
jgi:hypothetical protein